MDKQTLKQTFDLLSLVEVETTLKRVGHVYQAPCPFCGGRDRFTLKQTAQGWRWHCRHCANDMWNDPIAYVMKRDSLSFVEALKRMGGNVTKPREKAAPPPVVINLPSVTWQDEAFAEIDQACTDLQEKKGERAREYLLSRGLSHPSWYCHLLGYGEPWNLPAIVIPHFDNNDHVTAIKYRLLDGEKGNRYRAKEGSTLLFWGLHNAFDHHKTLVLVEGELNGISISQVTVPHGTTVISFGSENITGAQKALLPVIAGKYQRVIVWCDKAEKTRDVQKMIGKPCELIQSPNGRDANDLMCDGTLQEFVMENDE